MAASLVRRAGWGSAGKNGSLFRLRNLTTTSPLTPTNPSPAPGESKRKKQKNFFEVAQFLPNWGIGYHMAKKHWTAISYQITKIYLYKDGRHGKAWGIVHKDGLQAADAPKKISGVHKRCWKYIKNLKKPRKHPKTRS